MDLSLFFSVLRRFKRLVFGGIVLAAVLAVFTYGSPKLAHGNIWITPRGSEIWQSQSRLLITYPGFPYGRTQQQQPATATTNNTGTPSVPTGFQTDLASLGVVYSNLANSDAVQSQLLHGAPAGAAVKGVPVYDPNSGLPQPFVSLSATAPTGASATLLAQRAAQELQNYIANQQSASGISPNQRVQLQLLQSGARPQLVQGHKITGAAFVFLAVLTVVVSLAFILQNVRPRRRAAAAAPKDERASAFDAAEDIPPDRQVEALADGEGLGWLVGGKPVEHAAAHNGGGPAYAPIESDVDADERDETAAREPVKAAQEPVKAAQEPVKAAQEPVKAGRSPSKPRRSPSKPRRSPSKPGRSPSKPGRSPSKAQEPVKAGQEPVKEQEAQADPPDSANGRTAEDEYEALPHRAESVGQLAEDVAPVEALADGKGLGRLVDGKPVEHAAAHNGVGPAYAPIESDVDADERDETAAQEPVKAAQEPVKAARKGAGARQSGTGARRRRAGARQRTGGPTGPAGPAGPRQWTDCRRRVRGTPAPGRVRRPARGRRRAPGRGSGQAAG